MCLLMVKFWGKLLEEQGKNKLQLPIDASPLVLVQLVEKIFYSSRVPVTTSIKCTYVKIPVEKLSSGFMSNNLCK